MAVVCKLLRFGRKSQLLNKQTYNGFGYPYFCSTVVEQPKSRNFLKMSLIGASVGVVIGAGYSLNKINQNRENISLEGTETENKVLKEKPPVVPSRKIVSDVDTTGLKLTLFQYQTCPFCCKVRTFLDYYGISYDVVEVNPVLRKEIKWSSYKKVPILLAKVNDGYQPLNDSSMIMSLLGSYINDSSQGIDELVTFYPNTGVHDDKGNFKQEIINKYFLMYRNGIPKGKTMNDIVEERRWRKWVDDVLVHTLSPNVYRTLDEAYQTFNWFSKVGRWEEYFPAWERILVINVGASAMWLISKRLKKKHHLKQDVRQSLYDEVNYWMREIHARGTPFMGGHNPDLSDLSVYGIFKSIEGCSAFNDLLDHTNFGVWFNAMKDKVDSHAGSVYLNR